LRDESCGPRAHLPAGRFDRAVYDASRSGLPADHQILRRRLLETSGYAESAQPSFFGPEIVKQDNEIVAVVRKRLKDVARFSFVPESLPMKNSANTVLRLSRSR
jgi:hypothetical protein